jgi:hypothetical protein
MVLAWTATPSLTTLKYGDLKTNTHLLISPSVKAFAISSLPIFLFQMEGILHYEALSMPASVLNRAPPQAIMDTNASTSSASYEVHGDGGISFHQVRLLFCSIYLMTIHELGSKLKHCAPADEADLPAQSSGQWQLHGANSRG